MHPLSRTFAVALAPALTITLTLAQNVSRETFRLRQRVSRATKLDAFQNEQKLVHLETNET